MLEVFRILGLIAIVQGFVQGTVLFILKKNRFPNRILAGILFAFALSNLHWNYYYKGDITAAYHLSFINLLLFPVVAPMMYFYVLSVTGKIKGFHLKDLLHCVPFVPFSIATLCLFFHDGSVGYTGFGSDDRVLLAAMAAVFFVLQVIYFIYSYNVLRRYGKTVRDLFSYFTGLKINVVFMFLLGGHVMLLWLVMLWVTVLRSMVETRLGHIAFFGYYALYLLLTFAVTYVSIRYLEVFTPEDGGKVRKSYETHNIDDVRKEEYRRRIIACMEEERPYLDDALTLKDFAGKVDIPPHLVSMTLNLCLNQNFYNFINRYRIEEVKRMMADSRYDDHTLLRIAFSAGFNSKTAFNTMFKKFTGLTPSQYRNKKTR